MGYITTTIMSNWVTMGPHPTKSITRHFLFMLALISSGPIFTPISALRECCLPTQKHNFGIPSGKHTENYGKSPFSMGKIHYKSPFSIAMFVYQRINRGISLGLEMIHSGTPEMFRQFPPWNFKISSFHGRKIQLFLYYTPHIFDIYIYLIKKKTEFCWFKEGFSKNIPQILSFYWLHIMIPIQDGAPPVISWFINPIN